MAASGKWIEGIGPETTVTNAALRSLELRLAVVAHMLPLAAHLAEHDIEHVHRLRVATRRAAAALKLYRDWLPQKSARWIKKRLRQIRRAASEARDLDVLIQRLQRDSGTQAEPIVRFLVEKRAAVQPDIIEAAEDMRRDDRFVRKAARLFRNITFSENESEGTSPERLRIWAPQQLASFRSAFLELLPNGSDDIEALHQFRICTKALRYAIELLAPAFEPQVRDVVYPAVEKLQERLGKITDHIAAIRLFAEWESHNAAQAPREGASFLDVEKAQEVDDLRDFRDWWSSARADWLEQSLANQTGIVCGQS
ncbi:MAG TPA: CHAD domain-containing protein [Burkholderiales bacterium]|nr:CHAD domain-containing protein [Burkholderiales bacterium]